MTATPELTAAGMLALGAALAGCGASAGPREPAEEPRPRAEAPGEPAPPFDRVTALPAAPRLVLELDLEALRPTPLFAAIEHALAGDSASDLVGQRVLARTDRVTLGLYGGGRRPEVVLIARGPLEGVIESAVDELRARGDRITPVDRLGFTAWYASERMVIAQTAPDTVVLSVPHLLDETLRGAAGQAPVTPLPEGMRVIRQRPSFADATATILFESSDPSADDPLSTAVREAGWAGVGGHVEGDQVVVAGAARLPDPALAARLATDIEQLSHAAAADDVGSETFADGLRNAQVSADGRWLEIRFAFPVPDLERFMELIEPLHR